MLKDMSVPSIYGGAHGKPISSSHHRTGNSYELIKRNALLANFHCARLRLTVLGTATLPCWGNFGGEVGTDLQRRLNTPSAV
jgi:hypothetical protein